MTRGQGDREAADFPPFDQLEVMGHRSDMIIGDKRIARVEGIEGVLDERRQRILQERVEKLSRYHFRHW